MSIWGKVIGGAAGFALGGPLGAFVGALAGHAVDSITHGASDPETRRVAFTIAVIVLGAKMAKADGQVTRDEVEAFKSAFRIPPEDVGKVAQIFDRAKQESSGFEPYARQLKEIFADQPAVLEELLGALFQIAKADGVYHEKEREFLRRVAGIFGFDESTFQRIEANLTGSEATDPYAVLGLPRGAPDAEVKAAYRRLIREHHPDRLIAEGMPQEFVDVANDKLAAINGAYEKIRKERALS